MKKRETTVLRDGCTHTISVEGQKVVLAHFGIFIPTSDLVIAWGHRQKPRLVPARTDMPHAIQREHPQLNRELETEMMGIISPAHEHGNEVPSAWWVKKDGKTESGKSHLSRSTWTNGWSSDFWYALVSG